MGYSSEQEIEISGPPQWIVACIFIALAGLVLPLLLIPVVKTLGYSEIIEEIAKAVVVLIIVLKIPRLKSKIMTIMKLKLHVQIVIVEYQITSIFL